MDKGRDRRMSAERVRQAGGVPPGVLSVGLVRAKFGYGLAAAGVTAAMQKATAGNSVSPRKRGARLYLTGGM